MAKKNEMNGVTLGVAAVLFFVAIAFALVWIFKGENEEKYRQFVLKDNAYGFSNLPSYSRKGGWPIPLPDPDKDHKENYKGFKNTPAYFQGKLLTAPIYPEHQAKKVCSSNDECHKGQVCIEPSYYGGGDHGYCMYTNDPGIPRSFLPSLRDKVSQSQKESFKFPSGLQRCAPGYFFNDYVNQCQPIFQGSSTAKAINSLKPAPPPDVYLPGTTFPGYGVGYTDPLNVPFKKIGMKTVKLVTDQ